MTTYDDMRGYVHTHDRNGWFDVIAETTPMYQMIDKADAENAKLRAERDYLWMNANPTAYELRTVRAQWKNDRDENAKLRELVYDMLVDEERGHNDELTFDEHVERANELGVEFRG